ncbi:unnamed protein product, partial [marine sediment metagenome]
QSTAEQTIELLADQISIAKDQAKLQIDNSKLNADRLITHAETQAAIDNSTAQALHEEDLAFLNAQYEAEIGVLDDILSDSQKQINALRGIDDSVKSVEAALIGFRDALISEDLARINSAGTLEQSTTTPGFASGGSFGGGMRVVGEKGPELEFTGASRITSNSDLKSMLSQEALVEELKQLRSENRQLLTELAFANRKIVKKLDKWDGAGLPNFVETQPVEVV